MTSTHSARSAVPLRAPLRKRSQKQAFRRQRPTFRPLSTPYAHKTAENPRGWFPSEKCGNTPFWTLTEFKFLGLLECDPQVKAFTPHPHSELVSFRDGPNWLLYVPHFRVELANGIVAIVELSPLGRAVSAKQVRVAELLRTHYADQGVFFREVSYDQVRALAVRNHVLTRYLSSKPTVEDIAQALDALSMGPKPLAEVSNETGLRKGQLLAMIRHGELVLASRGAVTPDSLVAIAGGAQ